MLTLPASAHIFLAREPVDFRKGFDGLFAIVRDSFGDDPFSGHLFLFLNRRRDRVKCLVWDRNGFWIFYKRLERGTFRCAELASSSSVRVEINRATLAMLLEGIDLKAGKIRKHFAEGICIDDRRSDAHDTRARATG